MLLATILFNWYQRAALAAFVKPALVHILQCFVLNFEYAL